VTLYTKDSTYELANPADQFFKSVMDAMAQLDNAQRAERTRLGKLARVKQGFWLGGPPPFGYSVEKKHLVVNKEESEWVSRIFTEYANQTPTIDIKVLLDSNGVKPRRMGKGWALGSIQALLRNTHYLGYWEYNDKRSGESIRVECPRILSSALWKKVEATKKRHKERRSSENPQKHFYLLTGLIRCAHCGKLMSGETRSSVGKQVYLLAGIDFKLLDTKTHQLTVQFQLPIVNDSLEYESKGKKSGPYRVHEGSRSLTGNPP